MIRRLLKKFSNESRPGALRDRLGGPVFPGFVETLEERIVLSGTTSNNFGGSFIHTATITLTDGPVGEPFTIGLSENNLGTFDVSVLGPSGFPDTSLFTGMEMRFFVNPAATPGSNPAFFLNGANADLILNSSNATTLQNQSPSDPTRARVTWDESVANLTLDPGTNNIYVTAFRSTMPGTLFTIFNPLQIENDRTRPAVQSFGGIPAGATSTPISSVTVNFSEDVTGFGSSDVTLMRDGAVVDTSFTVTPTPAGSQQSFTITGLNTASDGNYELIVNQSGVTDAAGNSGTGTASATWTQDSQPPTFSTPPMLSPGDDVGRDESGLVLPGIPAGSAIKVTNLASALNGLTFTGVAPSDAASIQVSVQDLSGNDLLNAPVNATIGGGQFSATITNGDFTSPPFGPGFGTETFKVIATAFDSASNSAASNPLYLVVDNEAPAAPDVLLTSQSVSTGGVLLTGEANPAFTFPAGANNETNAAIIVERADGIAPAAVTDSDFNTIATLQPAINQRIQSFTDASATADGTRIYRFKQIDLADNDPATSLALVVDSTPPTITNLQVDGAAPPPSGTPLIDVTQPTFTFTVTDQQYAALDNPLLVELVDENGGVLASTVLANPAGTDGTFQQNVSLAPGQPLAAGQHHLFIRVTDQDLAAINPAAGSASTQNTPQEVLVTVTSADTAGAPGTPVFGRIYDLRTIGTDPGGTGGQVLLPNGTPVNFTGSHVWQTSFDKTTQTIWMNLEHGLATGQVVGGRPLQNPGTIQFDPATGQFKLFDYRSIFGDDAIIVSNNPPGTTSDARNPHGDAFDFDGHVNPRVWIAHRNAMGGSGPGNIGGPGRISYIDLRPNAAGEYRVVTYDISKISGLDLTDFHATFVDSKGTLWVTSSETSSVLEIDFDIEPDPADPTNTNLFTESPTIDSTTARVKVHSMPFGMLTGETGTGQHSDFHGHAQKVVVDDQTGEQYVWIASVGGRGQVALLRPGAGENGEDVWMTWDIPGTVPAGSDAEQARIPFLEIDDNETPGDPTDDRIIYVAPVPLAEGVATGDTVGIVQVFEPGIIPDDPMSLGEGRLRTYQVSGLTSEFAALNQPYLDREGGIYWIDRLTGVGRIDIGPAVEINPDPAGAIVTPRFLTSDVHESFFISPTDEAVDGSGNPIPTLVTPTVGFAALDKSQPFFNEAVDPGVNQYRVIGSNGPAMSGPNQMGATGSGVGAFRGAINAGNVLYGALTTSDEISATVFAETTRRQMAVVRTSDTLTAGALVEGRMAFQVARTGDQAGAVIMTFRDDGQILDQQVNLTNLVAQQNGIANPADIGISGDVAAVRDDNGNVYVIGKGGSRDLIAYRFDRTAGTWGVLEFGDGSQLLPAEPSAVFDSTGQLVLFATDSEGDLLVFRNGAVERLSGIGASQRAYGNVSVLENSDGTFSVYAANQAGGVVEHRVGATPATSTVQALTIVPGSGFSAEEIRVFQSVTVKEVGGVRHLFGNDGSSRLVHMTLDATSGQWTAENVTRLTQPTATGYFSFQQPYAARIYSEIAVVEDGTGGNLFVYGTNGGDLVEFKWDGSNWSAANLTNDMTRGSATRVAANNVFGAPDAYLGPDGARHVLQINSEGEVVEYVLQRDGTFSTQNVNLARGNDVSDLREFEAVPVIRLPGGPALFAQNGTPTLLDPNARLVDGMADLTNKTIIIRVVDPHPSDVLSFSSLGTSMASGALFADGVQIGSFTSSVGRSKLTIALNANATPERVQSVLREVQFSEGAAASTDDLGSRLIDFAIKDSSGSQLNNAVKALAVLSQGALDAPLNGGVLV